jgi:hypothetical protein
MALAAKCPAYGFADLESSQFFADGSGDRNVDSPNWIRPHIEASPNTSANTTSMALRRVVRSGSLGFNFFTLWWLGQNIRAGWAGA